MTEKGCQTCKHKDLPAHIEPCKTCVAKWTSEGKHSTGWEPIRLMGDDEG